MYPAQGCFHLNCRFYAPDLSILLFLSVSRLILGEFQWIILSLFYRNIIGWIQDKAKPLVEAKITSGKKRVFYPVYFNGKACKLKPIIFALIVKRCKITWNTLSNSLMVAQHTQKQLRFILRYLKIVHRFCEHTKRLKHSHQCSCVAV